MGNKVTALKPYIVYWNNIPAPYMVERFNAIADRKNLDFEAWFNDRLQPDRSWNVDESTWRFKFRYLPSNRIAGYRLHWPTPILGRRPDLLVSLYAEPAFLAGWAIAKLRGSKTCFRVLMTHDRWVSRHPIKEMLKRFLFKRVDGVETPGNDGKKFAMYYGASSDRVFFATHTVDILRYRSVVKELQDKRDLLRQKLQLKGTVFIYVGRMWWGKGVHYLLDAFEQVQHLSRQEVSLILVGDGPECGALQQKCADRGIRNVVFTGFCQKENLPKLYAVADVFVFPTLGDPYGLVVDEAMACSLPIISTSAAGEIRDRVEDNVNGYIVPPEDSSVLSERMLHIVNHPEEGKRMGKFSADKINGHTPERWAEDFELIVKTLLK